MAAKREDDPTISGDILLWRRIPPWADRVAVDPQTGEPIPSSMNFRDKNDELSVFLASETTLEELLAGHEGFGVVEFTAQTARELLGNEIVIRRDEAEMGHVLICGRMTRAQSSALAKRCRWVTKPRGY